LPLVSAPAIRILGIPGSLREGSHTRQAVAQALQGARQGGVETELLDLRSYELPLCDGRSDESTYPPGVERFRQKLRSADGYVIGTPEYHGSFSGVLKNALDLCGFEEFEGKVVGLVSVSGGAFGGLAGMGALRGICRSLHAWVIPEEAAVPRAGSGFTADGKLTDAKTVKRLEQVGAEVARFAFLRTSPQVKEFLAAWESAQPNPGGPER
jgi:NAD(P)H-dependent FMN reductase